MRRLKLGIVSGCHPAHNNVAVGEHFPELMPKMASDDLGISLEVAVNSSVWMPTLWRVSEACTRDDVDAIVLLLRTAVLVNKSGLVYRSAWRSRSDSGAATGTGDGFLGVVRRVVRTARLAVRAANIALGVLCGFAIRRSARTEIEDCLHAIELAAGYGVPVFVVGATPADHWGPPGRYACGAVERAFVRCARQRDFVYVTMGDAWRSQEYLDTDGMHLTAAGQLHVARRLIKVLGHELCERAHE